MPLSKKRMTERKRQDRMSNLVKPNSVRPVKPSLPVGNLDENVKPSVPVSNLVKPNQDKLKALRKLMKVAVTSEESIELIPFYNPRVHKPGDVVRMRGSNTEVIVPELDGDGHPVPSVT